ncbi:rod shape-determining protein MreC [Planctomicrobium sp. SH661]|uniref:rod shape-determining protein MreC n=1 Tax=Planctomicrobium sp. SH661 TaxID=3448124 RepID=UPI003F5C8491
METSIRIPILVWTGWLLVTLFLQAGPEKVQMQIQSGLQALAALGLESVHVVMKLGGTPDSRETRTGDASADRETLAAQNRMLAKLVADLQSENDQLRQAAPLTKTEDAVPLVDFHAIPTRILGQRGDQFSDSLQLLISLGSAQGIHSGELVLSGKGLVIDQGKKQGITPDQLVTAGRGLFGRTVRVGKETSLVQPVTDPAFRMGVRIVRRSAFGAVQGPQGILVGTGTGCRLTEVTATEAVAVGDEVYTDRLVSPGSEPVYCGRITRAEVQSGENHWSLEVAPLQAPGNFPRELFILRAELNPDRIGQIPAE